MPVKLPPFKYWLISFVSALFMIQIVSLAISSIFTSIPILKFGSLILLILLLIAIISLIVLSLKIEELKKRDNLIFIIIIFGLILLAYWKLPSVFPQIFSISPDTAQVIQSTVGSIMGGII